jgi:putative sterol carrier protein
MTPKTIPSTDEIMATLPDRFRPKMAGKMQAIVQFELTGNRGGSWTLTISDGSCSTSAGSAKQPDATVTMSAVDFVGINTGAVYAPDIFWSGQIDIQGDVEVVIALALIFGWQ